MNASRFTKNGQKNILHIIEGSRYGGAQTIALDISKNLKSPKNLFFFLIINRSDREHSMQKHLNQLGFSSIEVKTYNLRRLPSYRISRLLEVTLFSFLFLWALLKFKVSLVHNHLYQLFFIYPLLNLLRFFHIPFVWTLHGDLNYSLDLTRKILNLLSKIKTRKNNVLITQVSKNLNKDLWKSLKLEGFKTVIVPNGVDLNLFTFSPDERMKVREKLGVKNEDKLISFVGRLEKEKGGDILINAMNLLSDEKNIKLIMIGKGSLFNEYQKMVRGYKIKERVIFVGAKKNIPKWLSAMDIFVQPSRAEGFGLALLEAMAAGLPTIATSVGGIPHLLDDGDAGILVPPDSPKELASAIRKLTNDREIRDRLSHKAVEQAKKFSMEKMVHAYQEIYQSLL